MTPLLFVLASFAGGVGACLRYLVDTAVSKLTTGRFPWGIVLVNITGAFALGVVTTSIPDAAFIVGVGFLGGYTTFSTAMIDTIALWRDATRRAALVHLLGMFAISIIAAVAGLILGSLM